MKYKELPDLTAMHEDEVCKLCENIEGEVIFKHISNGRYKYDNIRVIRYKIVTKDDDSEELVCEMTGFPVLEDDKDEK